ncbi:MAG: hypothetical protein QG641_2744 [Candidatus Poribacteria bacterium]|nr:hypothetical protein [Candidatus Poribacteria bacterium]
MYTKRFTAYFLASFFLFLLLPFMAKANITIIGSLAHERNVETDKTYQGVILIRNTEQEPQEVKIYQTDYLFFSDGKNIYGTPAGKDPRSNALWIVFSPSRLTIPAKATYPLSYTIKVPDDKTMKGTFWSMLMIEPIPKNSPEAVAPEQEKVNTTITQIIRYGFQIITHIGDTGKRELKFVDTQLLKEQEKRILQVDIENVGERQLKPQVWVEIYDKETFMGKFEGGITGIYPSASTRYHLDLSGMPEGEYKALVLADCGGDDVFGCTYTLKLK